MYEGEWINDVYHGHGKETWDYNSISYEGDFKEGQKTGKGKFDFEGNSYEGDFINGQFHGFGKYYFVDSGKVYTGQFIENNIEGEGRMDWSDGSYYIGDFVNGKMEGKGIKTFANGNSFEGLWKNNLQHGQGTYYNAKTDKATQEVYREGKKWTWAKNGSDKQSKKVNLGFGQTDREVAEKKWNKFTKVH
uniref:Uncharacterized protein n=1 Tax=Strombidium inclinatum TaxID=197538 RepID=A0A7S3MWI8_9SPIT|mmetsp:Transcript_22951/g.35382  ORF Transcript_22951/g.35382 Transcript_22951/m.35382 type:complete len:190 (+) Transcript_22951:540-1109(+)